MALPAYRAALAVFPGQPEEDRTRHAVPALALRQSREVATAIWLAVWVDRQARRPGHAAQLVGGGALAGGSCGFADRPNVGRGDCLGAKSVRPNEPPRCQRQENRAFEPAGRGEVEDDGGVFGAESRPIGEPSAQGLGLDSVVEVAVFLVAADHHGAAPTHHAHGVTGQALGLGWISEFDAEGGFVSCSRVPDVICGQFYLIPFEWRRVSDQVAGGHPTLAQREEAGVKIPLPRTAQETRPDLDGAGLKRPRKVRPGFGMRASCVPIVRLNPMVRFQ